MPDKEYYFPDRLHRASDFETKLYELDDPDAKYSYVKSHVKIGKVLLPTTAEEALRFFDIIIGFRTHKDLEKLDPTIKYLLREKKYRPGVDSEFSPVELIISFGNRRDSLLLRRKMNRKEDIFTHKTYYTSNYFLQATSPRSVCFASRTEPVAWGLDNNANDQHGYLLTENEYTISYERNGRIRIIPESAAMHHQTPEFELKQLSDRTG